MSRFILFPDISDDTCDLQVQTGSSCLTKVSSTAIVFVQASSKAQISSMAK